MTHVKHYTLSMYGIKLNDGTWMKCANGEDWYHFKEIAEEILPRVVDETITPYSQPAKSRKTPSESWISMKHRRQVALDKTSRRYARRARNGKTVRY